MQIAFYVCHLPIEYAQTAYVHEPPEIGSFMMDSVKRHFKQYAPTIRVHDFWFWFLKRVHRPLLLDQFTVWRGPWRRRAAARWRGGSTRTAGRTRARAPRAWPRAPARGPRPRPRPTCRAWATTAPRTAASAPRMFPPSPEPVGRF